MLHFCVIVLFVPNKHVKKLIKRLSSSHQRSSVWILIGRFLLTKILVM